MSTWQTRSPREDRNASTDVAQRTQYLQLAACETHLVRHQQLQIPEVAVEQTQRDIEAADERRTLPADVQNVRVHNERDHGRLRRARLECLARICVSCNEILIGRRKGSAHQ